LPKVTLQATAQRRVTVPGRGGEGVALPIVMQSADPSADAFGCSGESLLCSVST